MKVYYTLHKRASDSISKKDVAAHDEHAKKVLAMELGKLIANEIEIEKREVYGDIRYTLEYDPAKNYKLALDEVLNGHSDRYVEKIKEKYNLGK